MFNRMMRCALLVLAAASWPAWAEESPIGFVSGPLAGVPAENAKHIEEQAADGGGIVRVDTATFSTRNLLAYVDWSRLPGGYSWRDTDRLPSLSQMAQRVYKATGFTVVRGDQTTVNGYRARYRVISLTGSGERCGVFDLQRRSHLIQGVVCAAAGEVPLMAALEGLSIDNVIGP
ncbi:hypothetical protein ACFW16_33245 [Inquilinus sp. NPDC058860]|uniref:hypothetical protein n=1 Tax=Inquilinus sp. NPDC058860 TaxID=3346652 RepID=UPI0036C020CC